MNYFNTKTLERLQKEIVPYLKKKSDWEGELKKKVWEVLTTDKATFTLVGEIKGHIKLKNDKEEEYLVLWLQEGKEKIHVYEDKLKRPAVWQEILDCKYRKQIVYLDFQKLFTLKTLVDIRYENDKS